MKPKQGRGVRTGCQNHKEIVRIAAWRINGLRGRGSWIRTNDLQYPKLPRYQAALYPDQVMVDTRSRRPQQGAAYASCAGPGRHRGATKLVRRHPGPRLGMNLGGHHALGAGPEA